MEIELKLVRKNLIVRLKGELDHHTASCFREEVEREFEKEIAQNLVLNLGELTFMDSSGLGVILGRYRRITEKGGKVVVTNMQPQVERLYSLSGLQKIIPHYRREEEALRNL
ncbi:MAG: anti-sigma F factor antagonist [Dethiobacteria bacterium]|jgi:stage II sporulation protein AA (anti-sigma F factor antagonist)|nr:anti-sigma F factor antagonist [Bacillota bacterium]